MSSIQTELSVIILNWNAAEDTLRCVREVAGWQRLRPTIRVVDNGSTDNSPSAISEECPQARLIRSSSNLGFAGGNNRGITAALAQTDAPLLLLNNDAIVAEADVVRLVRTLRSNGRIGFVGPLLFDADNPERLLAAGGRDPVQHHQSHILQVPAGDPVREVDYVPGTVILGRPEVFRVVGLLDEDYFFAMEIADLCFRARREGFISVVDSRAQALHALSRSSRLRETLHAYYIIRNRFLFARKHHRRKVALLYSFWTLYCLALVSKAWMEGRQQPARAVWAGLIDGLGGRFGDQNTRVLRLCRQSPLA